MKIQFVAITGLVMIYSGLMFAATCLYSEAVLDKTLVVEQTLDSRSYQDIENLLTEIGYTSANWQAGVREVPRIKIMRIPHRWHKASATIAADEKKSIFFRLIGSGILLANEKILQNRNRLLKAATTSAALQDDWIRELAVKYRVIKDMDTPLTQQAFGELIERVDVIPPSLALAQGAIESGWGTSRFAVEGNSLFGQWDLSGGGIKPEQHRAEKGNYGIARYNSPQDSIDAYMLNLNTNRAYRELRAERAALRRDNKPLSGMALVSMLGRYSERGKAYIKELVAIMRFNKLEEADTAYLWDKGQIIINPII